MLAQVDAAISGYSNELCRSYDFFKQNYENAFAEFVDTVKVEECESDEFSEVEDECEVDGDETGEEVFSEEEQEDISEGEPSANNKNDAEEEVENSDSAEEDSTENSDSEEDEDEVEEEAEETDALIAKFPQWFLNKLYPANLPRFFVDLVHLRKYINNPQIEHFPYNDCNEIALPILSLIYSLLNNAKGEEFVEHLNEDGTVRHLYFTYLTRATKVTNVQYISIEIKEKPKYVFEPEQPNPLFLKNIFEHKMPELNSELLFEEIEKIPSDLQLYFLAMVYWLHKSQHCDLIHLHALIVSAVVLRTIDSKIPAERDIKTFQKRFGKIIKKERQVRDKEIADGVKRTIREDLLTLPVPERMKFIPKSDCYLVQNELLKHFHMQEIFKKKYDLYSSTILHAFAEFQSVVFQLHSLNALLDSPYQSPHMGQLYCGVFIYNLYDLFQNRVDIEYYVRNFIFKDSQMMFDLYSYLWQWCVQFVPTWKTSTAKASTGVVNKKLMKKKRQQDRRNEAKASAVEVVDPYADMLSGSEGEDDDFVDLNNKFCSVLKVS